MPNGIQALEKLLHKTGFDPRAAPLRRFDQGLRINHQLKLLMKHILGVDIAKDKLDCCLLSGGQTFTLQCANTARGFKQLMRWLKASGAVPADLQVCMEATGIYGEKLLQWLFEQGVAVSKVNP